MNKYPKIICITWGGTLQSLKGLFLDSCDNIYLGDDILDAFYESCVSIVFLSKSFIENCAKRQKCRNIIELFPNSLRQRI